MAYVGITDKLVNEVERTMRNLHAAELAALGTEKELVARLVAAPEFKAAIDTVLWGEYIDIQPRLSKFDKECLVALNLPLLRTEGVIRRVTINVNGPCFSNNDRWHAFDLSPLAVADLNVYHLEPMQALRVFLDAQHECNARWGTIIGKVKQFLKAAKSLNEAVKLWPDLRRYIDADTLNRLDTKAEKIKTSSTAADVLATVDIDAINTSTVLARMAGATLP